MGLNLMQTTRRIGAGTMGRNAEPVDQLAVKREEVRAARLDAVRRNRRRTELEETTLIPRGPFLVHAPSDELFVFRRGEVWEPDRASIGYVREDAEMDYFVDREGDVVFVERQLRGKTWSDVVASGRDRVAC